MDAHIHLEQYDLNYISNKIQYWKRAGIQGVIAVSNDLASSYATLELQQQYPDFVYAAVGFHPEKPLPEEREFLEWQKLLKTEKDKIVAIGEIGLPHYELQNLHHTFEEYIDFLSSLMDIAQEEDLPVALHAVHDKAILVLQMLQQKMIKKAHFHWLKAPKDVMQEIIKAGYYISVTPEVCYRARDQKLVEMIPLEQLLIETDGPWEYNEQYKNRLTTPMFLNEIVHAVSFLKGIPEQKVRNFTSNNTMKCYQLSNIKTS